MKYIYIYINILLFAVITLTSCQQDDRVQPTTNERDIQTQADLDDQKIRAFLTNYTFNDVEFDLGQGVDNVRENNFTHENIRFIRIKDDNGNNIALTEEDSRVSTGTPLINSDFLRTIPNIQFGNVNHTAYYLMLREGEGKPVTIADPIFSSYRGELLGGTAETFSPNEVVIGDFFDTQNIPVWTTTVVTASLGFREVASRFKTATPIETDEISQIPDENRRLLSQCQVFNSELNGEFTLSENNYGLGVAFIPAGLGFVNGGVTDTNGSDIGAYQNLIYSFTLFNTDYLDFDNDGIPSLLEMIDSDGNINSTIDTDNDGVFDYRDTDDDGDERLTRLEIELKDAFPNIDSNCDGIFTNDNNVQFIDQNENGLPDHLDNSVRVGL